MVPAHPVSVDREYFDVGKVVPKEMWLLRGGRGGADCCFSLKEELERVKPELN